MNAVRLFVRGIMLLTVWVCGLGVIRGDTLPLIPSLQSFSAGMEVQEIIKAGERLFVIGGVNFSNMLCSTDGLTWQKAMLPDHVKEIGDVAGSNGRWICLTRATNPGGSELQVFVSSNGINWGSLVMPRAFRPAALADAQGGVDLLGMRRARPVLYRYSGSWSEPAAPPEDVEWFAVASEGTTQVLVGFKDPPDVHHTYLPNIFGVEREPERFGRLASRSDLGNTWKVREVPINTVWARRMRVASYVNCMPIVACGNDRIVVVTPEMAWVLGDGTDWQTADAPPWLYNFDLMRLRVKDQTELPSQGQQLVVLAFDGEGKIYCRAFDPWGRIAVDTPVLLNRDWLLTHLERPELWTENEWRSYARGRVMQSAAIRRRLRDFSPDQIRCHFGDDLFVVTTGARVFQSKDGIRWTEIRFFRGLYEESEFVGVVRHRGLWCVVRKDGVILSFPYSAVDHQPLPLKPSGAIPADKSPPPTTHSP